MINLNQEIFKDSLLELSEIDFKTNNNTIEIESNFIIKRITWTKKEDYNFFRCNSYCYDKKYR